jgi:hypothetical protein
MNEYRSENLGLMGDIHYEIDKAIDSEIGTKSPYDLDFYMDIVPSLVVDEPKTDSDKEGDTKPVVYLNIFCLMSVIHTCKHTN